MVGRPSAGGLASGPRASPASPAPGAADRSQDLHASLPIRDSATAGYRINPVESLTRITRQPGIMGGQPCRRGLRVTAAMIVGQVGAGRPVEELLAAYPYREREDVLQALRMTSRPTAVRT